MYKLSITIPVFNAEDYLDTAMLSIINQTIGFENIEVILVDDCSKDNSRDIIRKYADKFDNVKYFFSDKNHGFPGFGRNKGIEMSTAPYIMFMDNDDELNPKTCEKLYDAIISNDADASCCDVKEIDLFGEHIHKMSHIKSDEEIITRQDDDLFDFLHGLVWNKLFKKEIIIKNEILFLTDNYIDDEAFCVEFYLNAKKMVYLNNFMGYYWNRRNDSLSNSKRLSKLLPLFIGYNYMIDLLTIKSKKELIPIISTPAIHYLIFQSMLLSSKKDIKSFVKEIYKFESKCEFKINYNSKIIKIINTLIINRHFTIAVNLIYLLRTFKNSKIVKKIFYKIQEA